MDRGQVNVIAAKVKGNRIGFRRRGDSSEWASRSKDGETGCGNFYRFFKTLTTPGGCGRFLTLENGIPSHDTFSRLFARLDPAGLQKALLRLAQDWADRLGNVVAVDGKALRPSFEDASERSPTHLLLTVRGGVEAERWRRSRRTASRTRSRRAGACWNWWT